uniref:Uncharacterized protein n=1 Tax=Cannabis sativa TaxID=3483 RepID=A0A803QBX2_CANSA
MATKNCSDGTSHHSSIALLQERFRQLQRAKEMREEKELLRLLSESERIIVIDHLLIIKALSTTFNQTCKASMVVIFKPVLITPLQSLETLPPQVQPSTIIDRIIWMVQM